MHVLGTVFSTWAHAKLNDNTYVYRAWREKRFTNTEFLSYLAFTNIAPAMMYAGVSTLLGMSALGGYGSDDDELLEKFTRESFKGIITDPLRGIPYAGDVAGVIFDAAADDEVTLKQSMAKQAWRGGPIQMATKVAYSGYEALFYGLGSDDPDEVKGAIMDLAHVVSFTSGIPASKLFEQFWKVAGPMVTDDTRK